MSDPSSWKLVLSSNVEKIEEAAYFIEKIAKSLHFQENEIDDLAIAVTEAVSNAIIHGNKKDQTKKVIIEAYAKNNHIKITVLDEGPGFDPKQIDNPLLPENLLKERGRGIFILKSLMDFVDYQFTGTGTKITLKKFKNKPKK